MEPKLVFTDEEYRAERARMAARFDPATQLLTALSPPFGIDMDGPGLRTQLYVYRCLLCCEGCFNERMNGRETIDAATGIDGRPAVRSVGEIVAAILEDATTEGVTVLGGEPMLQPEALTAIARAVRPVKSIMVYTGATWERIGRLARTESAVAELLAHVDILKCGPYIPARGTRLLWRGSTNQTVHFLTERYRAAWEHRMGEQASYFRIERDDPATGYTYVIAN